MPKNLVIVESPAKAKTIKKFLGKDFAVEASMGHVRDLPKKKIGVNVENESFAPTYEVPDEKKTVIKNLKKVLKEVDTLWIATDEDREGEAIGWHLLYALGVKEKDVATTKRIVFHEITEEAIKEAVANPRTIDQKLVDAQQARRVLDRLVGYTLSPFLWSKVYRGLSAGRVQSVAVRLIVDREREIQAFVADEYWTITADLSTKEKDIFTAELKKKEGKKFVPTTEEESKQVLDDLKDASYAVSEIEEKTVKQNPPAPFTTSTLQQTASNKLGFSVKQTMVVAQQLYEGVNLGKGQGQTGLITYMRTDSVNLSNKALADANAVIEDQYGREYLLSKPRLYKKKSKNAQEAHEAIRPTEMHRTPESLKGIIDAQQLKLYTLIWQRTVATQMPAAELKRIGADISAGDYTFRATGQTIEFDGYLRVYGIGGEATEEEGKEKQTGEKFLPPLAEGQSLDCSTLLPEQHFTKPPARYTEASLVRKLEEEGIGRPSTYAPTINTIQQRGYVRKEGKQLVPESVASTVTDLMTEHFPDIVDLQFTAKMEQSLDDIALGSIEWTPFIREFFGPFSTLVEKKNTELKKEDVVKERVLGKDPESGLEIIAKIGRFGPYVQVGRAEDYPEDKKPKSASIPKQFTQETVTLEDALAQLSFPKTVGQQEDEDVIVALGRFGPYIKWGKITASIPKDTDPASVDFDAAIQLISDAQERRKREAEPLKTLDKDPETGEEILVKDGRYGPYVTDGTTNASLGKKYDPDTITHQEAVELLAKKREKNKKGGGRRTKKKK